MKLNGMTEMVMVEEIIQREPLRMFAQMYQVLPRGQPRVVTDGVATTPMAMDGLTKAIDSRMNPLSGVIWMATDLETIPTAMKEMPAPMKEVNHSRASLPISTALSWARSSRELSRACSRLECAPVPAMPSESSVGRPAA